ncbi:MAG: hypothetical protein ACI9AD_000789 [Nitriliruptoraceae bacterium]|jgi:hypothetical protein
MGACEHRESMTSMISERSQLGGPAQMHVGVTPPGSALMTGVSSSATKARAMRSAPAVLRRAAPNRRVDAAIIAAARSRAAADGVAQRFLAEVISLY